LALRFQTVPDRYEARIEHIDRAPSGTPVPMQVAAAVPADRPLRRPHLLVDALAGDRLESHDRFRLHEKMKRLGIE
jgi:hypothetical protein